jgi:hypothetical protein
LTVRVLVSTRGQRSLTNPQYRMPRCFLHRPGRR